jgi:hypothetical protein
MGVAQNYILQIGMRIATTQKNILLLLLLLIIPRCRESPPGSTSQPDLGRDG